MPAGMWDGRYICRQADMLMPTKRTYLGIRQTAAWSRWGWAGHWQDPYQQRGPIHQLKSLPKDRPAYPIDVIRKRPPLIFIDTMSRITTSSTLDCDSTLVRLESMVESQLPFSLFPKQR